MYKPLGPMQIQVFGKWLHRLCVIALGLGIVISIVVIGVRVTATAGISKVINPSEIALSDRTLNERNHVTTEQKVQAEYVILVSIDGLRPDAVTTLGPNQLPNLYRFRREGAWTDNARTDYDFTYTMPNHTTMLTARHVTTGGGHGWTSNSDPSSTATIHRNKGAYVASCFDVAHDHGLRTAAYVGKSKFAIINQSYNANSGAPDVTGADNGKGKIDTYRYNSNTGSLTASFIAAMRADPYHLAFLHLRDPDARGHASGWLSSQYFNAVRDMDRLLGNLFDLVENDARFRGNTAIILTSDHGGIALGHSNPSRHVNYVIPFYVWGAGVFSGSDLYELNRTTRLNPVAGRPARSASPPPIRSGDAGNLALSLLGLPSVPGSGINTDQELAVDGNGNQLPVAVLAGTPTSGPPPLSVDFDASSSRDVDGTISGYEWDFGDGTSGSGATMSHTYSSVGKYTVTLVVTDDDGATGMASETITVRDPAAVLISFQDGVAPTTGYSGTRDTQIDTREPNTNFGSEDRLYLDGGPDLAILFKWDLSSLPTGSVVNSAEITFWTSNPTEDEYEIYEVKQDWVESEVTWNQYRDSEFWEFPGAGGSSDAGSEVLGAIRNPDSDDDFYTISLNAAAIALIQRWINDPSSNYGFIAHDYVNSSDGTIFHSREVSTPDTRPKLTLDYTPSGNSPPIARFTASQQSGSLSVDFDASASTDANGSITSYGWDFGDGNAGSGVTASHAYTTGGNYAVMLVVTDDEGATGTVTETVTVSDPNAVTVSFQDGSEPTAGYSGARDTKIRENAPGTFFGSDPTLEVDGNSDKAVLLKWDLSSLPAGGTVQSAEITIEVSDNSDDTYEVYEVKRDWEEGETNWQQFRSGELWQTDGASGSLDRGSDELGNLAATSTGTNVITLNETAEALIQRWIDQPSSNYGLILQDYDDAKTNGVDFASREATNVSHRPKLTVTYIPSINQVPVASFTASPNSGPAPLTVNLDASASTDSDGTITSYEWDFGDGSAGSGTTANHTYTAIGDYMVTLVVTDNEGAMGTVAQTITVHDPNAVAVSFQDGVAPEASYSGTSDTQIKSDEPNTIFGSSAELVVSGSPNQAVLLKWNLSSVPTGSTVSSARIAIEALDASADSYELYELKRDWVEGETNWYQYRSGESWQTEGANSALDRGTEVLGTVDPRDTGTFTIPLNEAAKTLVRKWIDNPSSNYGLILLDYSSATDNVVLASREATGMSHRPKFTLTYVPSSNQVPVASFTATPTSGLAPLSVDFDASASSDADGVISSYGWDFGDGNSGSGVTANHTYTDVGDYVVTLVVTDDGGAMGTATDSVAVTGITSAENADEIPDSPELSSNFPNPFYGVTSIQFKLPDPAEVNLQVIDVLGRSVGTLVNGLVNAGIHDVQFDASGLPSGVYLIRLRAGSTTMTRKMLRL